MRGKSQHTSQPVTLASPHSPTQAAPNTLKPRLPPHARFPLLLPLLCLPLPWALGSSHSSALPPPSLHVVREVFLKSTSEPGTPQLKPMAPMTLGSETQISRVDPTTGSVASDALRPLPASVPCCPLCRDPVGFPGSCQTTGTVSDSCYLHPRPS